MAEERGNQSMLAFHRLQTHALYPFLALLTFLFAPPPFFFLPCVKTCKGVVGVNL